MATPVFRAELQPRMLTPDSFRRVRGLTGTQTITVTRKPAANFVNTAGLGSYSEALESKFADIQAGDMIRH